jgi:hypothetical protein
MPCFSGKRRGVTRQSVGFRPIPGQKFIESAHGVAVRHALKDAFEANLSNAMKWLVRGSIPIAAILVPAAFFLSVLSPDAKAPNGFIYFAYVGAVLLALGVLVLGVGLVRRPAQGS